MDHGQYLIDELCRLSGFPRRTVRYYVQEGLVDPPAARGRGGFYSEVQLGQLARIRELQEQGYRLEAIRGLLAGAQELSGQGLAERAGPPLTVTDRPEVSSPAGPAGPESVLPGPVVPGPVGPESGLPGPVRSKSALTGPVMPGPALPGPEPTLETWTRIVVGPGVELHVSAETRQRLGERLGPAVEASVNALRSIIQGPIIQGPVIQGPVIQKERRMK